MQVTVVPETVLQGAAGGRVCAFAAPGATRTSDRTATEESSAARREAASGRGVRDERCSPPRFESNLPPLDARAAETIRAFHTASVSLECIFVRDYFQ